MLPWAVLMVPDICDLVGLYIQSNLENILPKTNFGLYRDDGFILLKNLNGQQMDKKRKTRLKHEFQQYYFQSLVSYRRRVNLFYLFNRLSYFYETISNFSLKHRQHFCVEKCAFSYQMLGDCWFEMTAFYWPIFFRQFYFVFIVFMV